MPQDKIVIRSAREHNLKNVESLSAYARQFLGQMDKPDMDYIESLSPAISIDHKGTSRNLRSTVGTVTEMPQSFTGQFLKRVLNGHRV